MTPIRTTTFALLSLLATSARAEPTVVSGPAEARLPLTLSIDAHRQWHVDQSYRLFGTRRSDVDPGLSASLEVARFARTRLDLGAGVQWSDDTATWEQTSQAERDQVTPSLSAALRWSVHRWFEPHLRVAGDVTRAKLKVTMSDGAVLEDALWAPGGSIGAGFRLRTGAVRTAPRAGGLAIAGAFIVEGGVHVGSPLSFDLARPSPADKKLAADRIPAASVPVGSLGRTEPYLRLSFALLI
jgi:hypothetical protein